MNNNSVTNDYNLVVYYEHCVQCSLLYCPNTTVAPGTTRTGSDLGDERYKYLEGKPLQSLYIDRHLIKHNHKIILNKMIIKSCAE